MKGYAAMLTGWAAAVIAFDATWLYTDRDVMGCMFIGAMVGFFVATAFLLVAEKAAEVHEKIEKKAHRPEYIKDDETGIYYMPMRKGKAYRWEHH